MRNETPQPLVSFIVTCYNIPEPLLAECLTSIRAVSLPKGEMELIVVDDGSDSNPLPALKELADDGLIYVRQHNQGLSMARNLGLRMATGRYVQFVDGDDRLVRSAYEHCLEVVRQKSPDMLMFSLTTDEKTDAVDRAVSGPVSGVDYLSHNNLHATACGYLFKRSALGELRFRSGIYHEDEEFTPLLLLRADTVCSTGAKAYYYRSRPHSITTETNARQTLKRLNDGKSVIVRLNAIADTLPARERTAIQRRVAQLTMDYIYNIIVQTQNRHYLERQLEKLRKEGLFPLPDRNYTKKYAWFRRMSQTAWGRSVMMRVILMLKREE
ncbi:MAG: glycosyltransferase family 2 protein [Prevotella sp.]|nr:glycosyltransferase family 2 protein [Prevotella sp.]